MARRFEHKTTKTWFFEHLTNSIMNSSGLYGSTSGVNSVRNSSGLYGSTSGVNSANNSSSSTPPEIFQGTTAIGHLTTNVTFNDGVSLTDIDALNCTLVAVAANTTVEPSGYNASEMFAWGLVRRRQRYLIWAAA